MSYDSCHMKYTAIWKSKLHPKVDRFLFQVSAPNFYSNSTAINDANFRETNTL